MSKKLPMRLFTVDTHEVFVTQYGSTGFLTLVWGGGKMSPKKYREYLERFKDAVDKLKGLGITQIASMVKADDDKALKFNNLFGLSPHAEVNDHILCRMEIK